MVCNAEQVIVNHVV